MPTQSRNIRSATLSMTVTPRVAPKTAPASVELMLVGHELHRMRRVCHRTSPVLFVEPMFFGQNLPLNLNDKHGCTGDFSEIFYIVYKTPFSGGPNQIRRSGFTPLVSVTFRAFILFSPLSDQWFSVTKDTR